MPQHDDVRTGELAALRRRAVDLVPEYDASLLARLGGSDLHRALARRGLVAFRPAPAQNRILLVTMRETAARLGLRRISDLRRYWRPVVGRASAGSTSSGRSAK
jgi:glycine betaine/choline ABC-type transport system substrate-binding protein